MVYSQEKRLAERLGKRISETPFLSRTTAIETSIVNLFDPAWKTGFFKAYSNNSQNMAFYRQNTLPRPFDKRDQMMRQNFNDEDKRILCQFGFSVGLAIIGVIIVIALV